MTDEQRLEQIRRYHCNTTEWATEHEDVGWLLSQLDAARSDIKRWQDAAAANVMLRWVIKTGGNSLKDDNLQS